MQGKYTGAISRRINAARSQYPFEAMTSHNEHKHDSDAPTIAVTGAGGMLGRDVMRELEQRKITSLSLDHAALDVTDAAACRDLFNSANSPGIVINCAAYTDVNRAESEEDLATAINGDGARNLAVACADAGVRLVHVSTDYVFDGTKAGPYDVTDLTAPLNAYGRSKLRGEQAIAETMTTGQWTIARTSWLYGVAGPNFVKTMLRIARAGKPLKVIHDQTGAPTYTVDLARALVDLALLPEDAGIVHTTNAGACTWFEFAEAIFTESGVRPTALQPCSTSDFPTPAQRPANSCLSPDSLTQTGIKALPHWRDALRRYIAESGDPAQ